jgi:predicted DNA-binding transcriptional regulator AlpA
MDTKEAAAHSQHAESTLEKLRTYGGGPRFAKRGRKVLYRQSDIDAWLAETVVSSTSELAA